MTILPGIDPGSTPPGPVRGGGGGRDQRTVIAAVGVLALLLAGGAYWFLGRPASNNSVTPPPRPAAGAPVTAHPAAAVHPVPIKTKAQQLKAADSIFVGLASALPAFQVQYVTRVDHSHHKPDAFDRAGERCLHQSKVSSRTILSPVYSQAGVAVAGAAGYYKSAASARKDFLSPTAGQVACVNRGLKGVSTHVQGARVDHLYVAARRLPGGVVEMVNGGRLHVNGRVLSYRVILAGLRIGRTAVGLVEQAAGPALPSQTFDRLLADVAAKARAMLPAHG